MEENKKKSKTVWLILLSCVLILVGFVISLIGMNDMEEELDVKEPYLYKFGSELVIGFDHDNIGKFKGIYSFNNETEEYEKMYDDYQFYVLNVLGYSNKLPYQKYMLFIRNDSKKYFLWDIELMNVVEDNALAMKDAGFGGANCGQLEEAFNIEKTFSCEKTTDFFELYLIEYCVVFIVDSNGNVIDIRDENDCDLNNREKYINKYDFGGTYFYGNMKVSGITAADLGLADNSFMMSDGSFYIQDEYDTECCSRYYVVSPEIGKVSFLKRYCTCE